jgi:hypothetical protein
VQPGEAHDHEHPQDDERVYGITTAESSVTDDITRRQKQYILTMLVRVVSIIVVVCVPGISWPVKIGLCLVATIIPYVAVIRANGGPTRDADPTNLMIGPPQRGELGSEQPELPGGAPEDFLRGEYVRGEDLYTGGAHAEYAERDSEQDERAESAHVFDTEGDVGHTDPGRVSQSSTTEGADRA